MRGARCVCTRSAIFPVRFTLFDQRTKAFLRIFEAVEFVEKDIHGMLESVEQRKTHAPEDGFLSHGEDGTGVSSDAFNELVHTLLEFGFRDKAVDQTELKSPL